jgi:dCMP deaminase
VRVCRGDLLLKQDEKMNKPSWDDYLLSMAFMVAMRSIDSETKHGCVIVDSKHSILATGYNSPPPGCNDESIPTSRPEKYPYFAHAEEAAIANAARKGVKLEGATAYITGVPCITCLRLLISAGIAYVVTGPVSSACVNKEGEELIRRCLISDRSAWKRISFREHRLTTSLFNKAQEYYIEKETQSDAKTK